MTVRHALIIEDDMIIALEIQELLADLGYRSFDFATTPAEALRSALATPPDLVTADVRIVGGTGLEAVDAIEGAIGDRPVVYITGNVDMVRRPGAVVVEKPIRERALREAWRQATSA